MAEQELQESVIHINRVAKVVKVGVTLPLLHLLLLETAMDELVLVTVKAQKYL